MPRLFDSFHQRRTVGARVLLDSRLIAAGQEGEGVSRDQEQKLALARPPFCQFLQQAFLTLQGCGERWNEARIQTLTQKLVLRGKGFPVATKEEVKHDSQARREDESQHPG